MREIKFRFWDTWNECFTYSGTNMIRFFGLYKQTLIGDNKPILEQYTGLKDKNGKEIYEGDIVRYNNRACEIFCKGASFGFWSDKRGYGEFCTGSTGIKIIGNIHENPKLIK